MGSNQDFRNLQAKFQASQEPGEPSRKPIKPEFNKLLKKFPQTELSEQPKKASQSELSTVSLKPLQLQFTDIPKKTSQSEGLRKSPRPELKDFPRKPPHPEFTDSKKPPQPQFASFPKPSLPEFTNLPKKLPKLEFGELTKSPQLGEPQEPSSSTQKPLKSELSNPARPPVELKPTTFPKKFCQPESSEAPLKSLPMKPLQSQATGSSRKSLTQVESSEVPQTSKPRSSEFYRHSPEPEVSTFPKKSLQSELNENFKKSPSLQATGCTKYPQQPMSYEVPQTAPWKPESYNPPSHSLQPDVHALPKNHPQLQLSDLTRTSSEPESKFPKKPQQPAPKVLSKKPSQQELGHLPRTSSEPEFSSLPRKFLKPQHGKFFQPDFPKGLPGKPKLPGSVSECSLPSAFEGSSPQFPLSPGYGVSRTPNWRSEDFQVQHPPQRRPLPSASSLGSPPAKPPLPPVPINIQSFRRASATATAVLKTHFPAEPQQTLQNPDEIYELYDAVEATSDSSLSPRGRDEMQTTQQVTRWPQQDAELRKNATQLQQLPPTDPKLLKQIRKAEKAEREFRKKFKFEGEIVIQTKMMIDPNAKTRRGGGKHLGIRRGEILEVIEFTNKDEMLCRDPKGKCKCVWPTSRERSESAKAENPFYLLSPADGYVPRTALLPLETEVYDDVSFWDPLDNQPFPQGQ
ncbi:PML-RARA-regulated adapter molecule 1 isoform X2 [Alexandromys fortis]|uniref:PML-RARA-regulated adapter molecule 1 isoform X2 n=1 Tax=Alexandromys fortis TaxID=100897 RepID=UPI0021534E2D|nr:PML-RARA-regulated adapter molecule 1 isoform X2 [Microtus fortis]